MACFGDTNKDPKFKVFPLPLHSRVVDHSSSPWIMFEDSQFARHVSYAKNRFIWMVDHTLCLAVTFSIASVAKLRCNVISLYLGDISCFSCLVNHVRVVSTFSSALKTSKASLHLCPRISGSNGWKGVVDCQAVHCAELKRMVQKRMQSFICGVLHLIFFRIPKDLKETPWYYMSSSYVAVGSKSSSKDA